MHNKRLYKTLIKMALDISKISSLYIKSTNSAKFPEIVIIPYKACYKTFYVTFKNDNKKLLGIVSYYDLFEDIRAMCLDWNILNEVNT